MAFLFTALQAVEYKVSSFTLTDGAYGSCFYFGTGFHGLHVIIGTIFIAVGFWRLLAYHLTENHHLGLEAGILYWPLCRCSMIVLVPFCILLRFISNVCIYILFLPHSLLIKKSNKNNKDNEVSHFYYVTYNVYHSSNNLVSYKYGLCYEIYIYLIFYGL